MDIIVLITLFVALVNSIAALYYVLKSYEKISDNREDVRVELRELIQKNQSFRKEVQETSSGTLRLLARIEELEQKLEKLTEEQEELKLQDPDSKLYARARKMISLGADIDEVVRECEIPKSEAEMLFKVNNGSDVKQTQTNLSRGYESKPVVNNAFSSSFNGSNPINKYMSSLNVQQVENDNLNKIMPDDSKSMTKEEQDLMQAFKR
jgi:hypothetical protein